jgi:hypothetical protein
MLRWLLIAVAAFAATPAAAKDVVKLGAECLGPVTTMAPKLGTCAIAGGKLRIWCPNGEVFDRAEERTQVALIRSLCNLTQIP